MRIKQISLLLAALTLAFAGALACSFGPGVYNGPLPEPGPSGDAGSGDDSGGSGDDAGDGGSEDAGEDTGATSEDGGGASNDGGAAGNDSGTEGDSGTVADATAE